MSQNDTQDSDALHDVIQYYDNQHNDTKLNNKNKNNVSPEFAKFVILSNSKITYLEGHLPPSSHCSILIKSWLTKLTGRMIWVKLQ
jgi:hypothetical protein